ncbi:MAG: deoxynucleoside kinase [Burkholderiales bacterium]|nr:deoxynucleoside kinase [Burkholderiales bacterium]MDQ3196885.1 deoxynucleoside kinase [Pseudomonadota bacterium]
MALDKYRYIAIEGPIGAGKTSLARQISERFGAALLLEDPDANPFLPGFYRDLRRYALPTQLFFLFQRIEQLDGLTQSGLFRRSTIADFLLEKDLLFARLTLNDDELRLYNEIYRHLQPRALTPDLVIYLQASPATLIERVKRRGLHYEKGITEDYLARLTESYSRFFHQYDAAPLLIINSDNLNFVDEPPDFDLLIRQINEMRGQREFFSLGLA